MSHLQLCWMLVLGPLWGAVLAGLSGACLTTRRSMVAHTVTIAGVAASFVAACLLSQSILSSGQGVHEVAYVWYALKTLTVSVGFYVDPLTCLMILAVTFVSLLVHLYSIGYMHDDPGYARFFSYISLFTFAMLMLVTADNFAQLFFGWEGVGLVSYLLIGFWFHKESALQGSLKAFLVNRVGDFGFLLGIACILAYCGSLDYDVLFLKIPSIAPLTLSLGNGVDVSVVTLMSVLLFVGAMGKSAQIPLHVWLPESMEGPTPISALIHAATMVTAGIFMMARLSPLFSQSAAASNFILAVGATGALFMGFLALVQWDIKRVVAYSTLSQLGYMTAAMGAGAYSVGLFHLLTHAAFKALLFLAAGSVIMGMHHRQDLREMGALRKKMPITHACFLIGSLALAGIPPFSGFFSKDLIIEAVKESHLPAASYAYACVLIGVFCTAFYSFRAYALAFSGKPRMDHHTWDHVHESPWVVTVPLLALAVPSVVLGYLWVSPLCLDPAGWMSKVLVSSVWHAEGSARSLLQHAVFAAPLWLALAGIVSALLLYGPYAHLPAQWVRRFPRVYRCLQSAYGVDAFNQRCVVNPTLALGNVLSESSDVRWIDGGMVHGLADLVMRWSKALKALQTGWLYHYHLGIVAGLLGLMLWMMWWIHHTWLGVIL